MSKTTPNAIGSVLVVMYAKCMGNQRLQRMSLSISCERLLGLDYLACHNGRVSTVLLSLTDISISK